MAFNWSAHVENQHGVSGHCYRWWNCSHEGWIETPGRVAHRDDPDRARWPDCRECGHEGHTYPRCGALPDGSAGVFASATDDVAMAKLDEEWKVMCKCTRQR